MPSPTEPIHLDGTWSGLSGTGDLLALCDEVRGGFRCYPRPGEIFTLLAELQPYAEARPLLGAGADDVVLRLSLALRAIGVQSWRLLYPSYEPHLRILRGSGCRVSQITCGSHGEDTRAVIESMSGVKGAILIVNPGNPTGVAVPADSIASLAIRNPKAHIVVDEAFAGYSDRAGILSHHVGRLGNLTIVQTLSKYFGLPGVRLGWAVTGSQAIADSWATNVPAYFPSPVQFAALRWLLKHRLDVSIASSNRRSAASELMRGLRALDIAHSCSETNLVYFFLPTCVASNFLQALAGGGIVVTHALESRFARRYFQRELAAGRVPIRVYGTRIEDARRLLVALRYTVQNAARSPG